jgi:hypothetical protein
MVGYAAVCTEGQVFQIRDAGPVGSAPRVCLEDRRSAGWALDMAIDVQRVRGGEACFDKSVVLQR